MNRKKILIKYLTNIRNLIHYNVFEHIKCKKKYFIKEKSPQLKHAMLISRDDDVTQDKNSLINNF